MKRTRERDEETAKSAIIPSSVSLLLGIAALISARIGMTYFLRKPPAVWAIYLLILALVAAAVGIVLGHVTRSKIKQSDGKDEAMELARTALFYAYSALIILVSVILIARVVRVMLDFLSP